MAYEAFYHVTLGDLLAAQADQVGDRVFLQQGDRQWTYREAAERAQALAAGLAGLGLAPGDRIAVIMPNIPEYVLTVFGASMAGLLVVPINTRRSEAEALARMQKTTPRALVVSHDPEFTGDWLATGLSLREAQPGLEHLILLGPSEGEDVIDWQTLGTNGEAPPDVAISPDDGAMIIHTLGSSGEPNGALLAHQSLVHNAAAQAEILDLTADDVFLGAVPFSNTFGLTATILTCAVAGARLVCLPRYRPAAAQALIASEKVTIHHGVPTMFAMELASKTFRREDYRSLRTGIMAGAPCPAELVRQVRDEMGLNVRVAYGLTEASPGVTMTRPDDGPVTATETVGHPLDGVEVKVVDESGNPLPPGEEGDLCVRGYNVMLGYWGDEAATARVLDADGWLTTGDRAVIDADGPVRIVGRVDDVIIRAGFKIYPATVEMALRVHPAIKEAAVVGVPDLILGEMIVACLVRREGAAVSADEVMAFATDRVAEYARPDRVVFFDVLPRRGSGPVEKDYLRARVRIRGHAFKFGRNVDTDAIIPARRCNTADPRELALYCMEDADPEFVNKMRRGDLIVADTNFGCGSSREVAPLTIKAAGVSAVIAKSFARIFFRNSINIGLPILECPEAVDGIQPMDEVEVEPASGTIRNLTRGEEYHAQPFPDFLQRIIEKGGLLAYVEERLAQQAAEQN